MNMNEYQRGIYLEEQITDCKSANNIGGVVRFEGTVDVNILATALKRVIFKHPNLRSSLDGDDFSFEDEYEFSFQLTENSFDSVEEYEIHLHEVFEETGVINSNRLFYSELCHVGSVSFLIIRCHHIIADGYSMASLANDLNTFWDSDCEYALPSKLKLDYGSETVFAENREEYLSKSRTPHMVGSIYEAKRTTVQFPAELQSSLKRFVNDRKYNLFSVLLYTFSSVLLHFQQEDTLQIGIPVSVLRSKKDRPIGMFVNIVPFFAEREMIESQTGIEQTKRNWFNALRNYHFPYYKIRSVVGEEFVKYDYTFNYLPNVYPTTIGGIQVEFSNVHPKYQMYRLQGLVETHNDNNMYMVLDWDIDSFAAGFDRYFIDLYFNVLKTVIGTSALTSDAFCLDIDKKIMNDCCSMFEPLRDDDLTTPYSLFRYNCLYFSNSVAIIDGTSRYTYKEFERDVLKMAAGLKRLGVESNYKVVLDMEHTYYELVIVYALLYLGGTMVPISGRNWEVNRVESIIEQVAPCLVISGLLIDLEDVRVVDPQNLIAVTSSEELLEADGYNKEHFEAYIIFTSGTTGVPKGVVISERALFSYLNWTKEAYKMSECDCMPLYTTMTFDFTLTSVYLPLSSAACVKVYCDDGIKHPLYDIFEDKMITVVKVTPSHMKILSLIEKEYCADLRLLIVGGENLSYETLERFRKNIKREFVCCNEYGPTEATIGCVMFFAEDFDKRGNVPIGLPSTNAQVRIVDEAGRDVPCYVKGQLLISGDCLSKGYWKDENKTANSFICSNGKFWYKSGDLAWYNCNGYIEYGGRIDSQKKYHGYRIELEEISNAVSDLPFVKDTVTLMLYQNEDPHIVLFYVSELGNEIIEESIKMHLYNKLPNYIVVEICDIDKIPLTLNGKIDEQKLRSRYELKLEEKLSQCNTNIIIEEELKEIISSTLGISELFDISKSFYELGGDSIKSFACLTMLKEKGYDPKQNYFRMPISIAEISRLLKKEKDFSDSIGYDIPFEPTSLIKRFVENVDDIGSVMQCIVIEIKHGFDATKFLEAVYDSFPCFRLTVTEEKKLLYRSIIQLPTFAKITYSSYDKYCKFDIETEGLFKLLYFTDIEKYGICVHHLAVDFVSWHIILEFINVFLSGKNLFVEKDASFFKYCDRNKEYPLFAEPTDKKKKRFDISILDTGLLEKILDSEHLYGLSEEILIKMVISEILSSHNNESEIYLESESIGRDNNETDIGWYTNVYYEKYDRDSKKLMNCMFTRGVKPIRLNYIPMYKIKRFDTFIISERLSKFEWNCNLDYEAEFDIIITREEMRLCVLTSDNSFGEILKKDFLDSLNLYLLSMKKINIDFSRDEDVDLDDLIKILG